jgi:hypothetical protein
VGRADYAGAEMLNFGPKRGKAADISRVGLVNGAGTWVARSGMIDHRTGAIMPERATHVPAQNTHEVATVTRLE